MIIQSVMLFVQKKKISEKKLNLSTYINDEKEIDRDQFIIIMLHLCIIK